MGRGIGGLEKRVSSQGKMAGSTPPPGPHSSLCLPARAHQKGLRPRPPGNFKALSGPGQGQRVPILLKLLFFTKIYESQFLRVLGVPLKSWMRASGRRHRRGVTALGDCLWALFPQGSHI